MQYIGYYISKDQTQTQNVLILQRFTPGNFYVII